MIFTPVPRDIPLPLPASPELLHVLLVVAFIAHILFVNLMVGGSILVLGCELRGFGKPDYDRLARELAVTVTVNKSLAVVLGVAPLLLINVLYTIHFYTANALTGTAWILLIPAIATAFLLLYLHKYTWDRLADHKWIHVGILAIAVALAGTLDGLFADVESVGLACQRCEMQSLVALAATEFEQAVEGSELALDDAVGGLEAGPLAR